MILKKMILRPYQAKFKSAIKEAFLECSSVMAALPTGGGKTVVFNDLVEEEIKRVTENGSRVLIVAHRKELIFQAASKFAKAFGTVPGIIKSKVKPDLNARIQVASIQTLSSWFKRIENEKKEFFGLKRWNIKTEDWKEWFSGFLDDVSLIVIDEAHLAKADSYKEAFNRCENARRLGFTATPYRLSGAGFTDIFDKLVVGRTIKELEKDGFLVPAKIFITPLSGESLSSLRQSGGDYKEDELVKLMTSGKITADAVKAYKEHASGKRGLIFCVNVEHSQKVVKEYISEGIAAVHIDGNTPDGERDKALEDLKAGRIEVVSNVGVWTTGTDIPEAEFIQLLRPTKSLSLFLQMVGRGGRPCKEIGKENYILLDHANNIIEFGAPNKDRDWNYYFEGTKNHSKRKFKEIDVELLLIDLDTARIYTPTTVPEGIDIGLIEITEDIRVQEISEAVKKGRKEGLFNAEVASKFVSLLSQRMEKGNKSPKYQELLILSALTGGTKRQAKQWSKRFGVPYPVEPDEFKPKPKSFSNMCKAVIVSTVNENKGNLNLTSDELKLASYSNPRGMADISVGVLFDAIVRNKEKIKRSDLVSCGIIQEF